MQNRKNLILGTLFTMILFSSCLSDKKNNSDSKIENQKSEIPELNEETTKEVRNETKENFKQKFAGSYTIETKGVSSAQDIEVYALNENGNASWLWLENDGKGGVNIKTRKTGTWTASENGIIVNIQGNSGIINESYDLKENVLTNTQLPKRYLKKTE
jgi:hypothetical protein